MKHIYGLLGRWKLVVIMVIIAILVYLQKKEPTELNSAPKTNDAPAQKSLDRKDLSFSLESTGIAGEQKDVPGLFFTKPIKEWPDPPKPQPPAPSWRTVAKEKKPAPPVDDGVIGSIQDVRKSENQDQQVELGITLCIVCLVIFVLVKNARSITENVMAVFIPIFIGTGIMMFVGAVRFSDIKGFFQNIFE